MQHPIRQALRPFRSLLSNIRMPRRTIAEDRLTQIPPSLGQSEITRFNDQGYLVLPDLLGRQEVEAVRQRIHDLMENRVTLPQGVKFEIEPDLSPEAMEKFPHARRYRQIWDIVPGDPILTEKVALNTKIVSSLKSLLDNDIKLYRATVMLKLAGIGSELPYHQDQAYWPIRPHHLVSCWLAIDDADRHNGCLRVIRGGHKEDLVEFSSVSIHRVMKTDRIRWQDEIHLEVKSGACVFFHSLLPHTSGPNHSERDRLAVISSYMPSRAKYVGDAPQPEFFPVSGRSYRGCV